MQPEIVPVSALTSPSPVRETVSLNFGLATGTKTAVREVSAPKVKEQVIAVEPWQRAAEPAVGLHSLNWKPKSAVAMTSTAVPSGWGLVQGPAEPPPSLHLTSPSPETATASVRWGMPPDSPNVAVTLLAALILTLHSAPEVLSHSPLQPANSEPTAAVAVSTTVSPSANPALQSRPQSIPSGSLATVPEPEPVLATLSVLVVGALAWAKM